jgi:hypothetical protein
VTKNSVRAAGFALLAGLSAPSLAWADEAAPDQPIVVTGRGLEAAPAAVAYNVQDLDRERLLVAASGRIEDALSAAAGFQQFRRSDSRASNPSAQGITLRALGGNSASDIMTLPNGEQVPAYRNIPIFRNDYIPINQTQGTSTACTTIFAGTLDDGSMSHGISGITAANEAVGMQVEEVGISETKDETITRVKWYCGLALFSLKGLAALKGVTN